MKLINSYTAKMKFAVINEWNLTHNIIQARQAAHNIPATVTCYRWIQQACSTGNPCNSRRFSKQEKRRAIRWFYSHGRNAKQTALRVGTTPNSVYRWVRSVNI